METKNWKNCEDSMTNFSLLIIIYCNIAVYSLLKANAYKSAESGSHLVNFTDFNKLVINKNFKSNV